MAWSKRSRVQNGGPCCVDPSNIVLTSFMIMTWKSIYKIYWLIDQVWGQGGWRLAKFFFFCVFMDQDRVKAILTRQAWPIKDLLYGFQGDFSCGIQQAVVSGQDSSFLPVHVANHSAWFDSFLPTHRASQIVRAVIVPTAMLLAVDIFMYYFSITASGTQQ